MMIYDMVPIGRSSIPEMVFGLNLGAEWKGFDFSMFNGNHILSSNSIFSNRKDSAKV